MPYDRIWSAEAVDARLADLDAPAADLGVSADHVRRFAAVRQVLLAGRARAGWHDTDLSTADLHDAGISVGDVLAYLLVADRLHERRAAEQRAHACSLSILALAVAMEEVAS